MRKRRVFDLDLPDTEEPETGSVPAPDQRRGPMAAAIVETGEALEERGITELAIRMENDQLAHAHVAARAAGLVAEKVPLDSVHESKLIRDRRNRLYDDGSMDELKESIRALGLSNPIRVEDAGAGHYQLIQGHRRLAAYKALLEETGDDAAWGTIPALVTPRGDDLEVLYRRMVDENLIRQDISFYEMAFLSDHYASIVDRTPEVVVAELFRSAGYQKRSYIRAFLPLVTYLDRLLRYPQDIPRALGLKLSARITEDETVVASIRAALKDWDGRSVEDELRVLRAHAEPVAPPPKPGDLDDLPPPRPQARPRGGAGARAVVHLDHPQHGHVVCTAGNGTLELALGTDLTRCTQEQLSAALRAFLDRIG